MPINMIGLFFLDQEIGQWVAILGLAGMIPNMFVMYFEKAFSKTMALSHVIPWTVLVVFLAIQLYQGTVPDGPIYYVAWAVLVVDTISLVFDYKESVEWFQERKAQ